LDCITRMSIRTVWCRTGPHLSKGCFQTRAWEGEINGHRRAARWLAQKAGMGHLEQQTGWARYGWVGRETNAHTQRRYFGYVAKLSLREYITAPRCHLLLTFAAKDATAKIPSRLTPLGSADHCAFLPRHKCVYAGHTKKMVYLLTLPQQRLVQMSSLWPDFCRRSQFRSIF
jgi:hypothetical protein